MFTARYGLPTRRAAERYICLEGFVTSTAAPIASGGSDQTWPGGTCTYWKTAPYHSSHNNMILFSIEQNKTSPPAETIIERRPGWRMVDLAELWRYRELFYFLTLRDVQVRYKQAALGAAWAILQPLATMLVFSLFFGRVAAARSATAWPYPLFVLTGLVPWGFFSGAIASAGQSVIGNERLVSKIYFPRLMVPLSAIGAGLVDFAVAATLLVPLMVWYGVFPGVNVLVVPLVVAALVMAVVGVGTLLAALTVAFRDFKYIVPFLTQLWMFATPAIYLQAEDVVGPWGRWLLPLNPAHGLIDNFRHALLGAPLDLYGLVVSSTVAAFGLVVGVMYFRRVEREFADII